MARERMKVKNASKFKKTIDLYASGLLTGEEAAQLLGMSRATFYRRLTEIRELKEENQECDESGDEKQDT
mgnify:CR=1 FL=1